MRTQVRFRSSRTAMCNVPQTGELDVVAVHERIEPSMVGAGYENVAGVQRVNRGDPFQRGILCAMSSELKFCMTTPLLAAITVT